eukprot:SAG31_NODE_6797_length_1884_cov_1.099720_1_plen_86_part_00
MLQQLRAELASRQKQCNAAPAHNVDVLMEEILSRLLAKMARDGGHVGTAAGAAIVNSDAGCDQKLITLIARLQEECKLPSLTSDA